MTEKFRDTLRLWNAVATQAGASKTISCQGAVKRLAAAPPSHQARSVRGAPNRAAKLSRRALVSAPVAGAVPPMPVQFCLPTSPLQMQAPTHTTSGTVAAQYEPQEQQQQQLWQRFVSSRRAVAIGAVGLGAGAAALALWGGGLLVVPALHLAGSLGAAAGAQAAGTVVAASLGAAACQGAAGGVAVASGGVGSLAMSNAVLSAAAGGSLLGSAGAASMLLYVRGLVGERGRVGSAPQSTEGVGAEEG